MFEFHNHDDEMHVDPDRMRAAEVALKLFQNETQMTIAWSERPLPTDTLTAKMAEAMRDLDVPGMKPVDATLEWATVEMPVALLNGLVKAAMVGCIAAKEIGVSVASVDEQASVEEVLVDLFANAGECARALSMALMTVGYVSQQGFENDGRKSLEQLSAQLEDFTGFDEEGVVILNARERNTLRLAVEVLRRPGSVHEGCVTFDNGDGFPRNFSYFSRAHHEAVMRYMKEHPNALASGCMAGIIGACAAKAGLSYDEATELRWKLSQHVDERVPDTDNAMHYWVWHGAAFRKCSQEQAIEVLQGLLGVEKKAA